MAVPVMIYIPAVARFPENNPVNEYRNKLVSEIEEQLSIALALCPLNLIHFNPYKTQV